MKSVPLAVPPLNWSELSVDSRAALSGKLDGLFGWSRTDEVFETLAANRQQALLLVLRRLQSVRLWDAVRRVTNVYGKGGVGLDFIAWPVLRSTLERRRGFTRLLGGHRNNEGGYRERKKIAGPALHLVMVETAAHRWAAHFDLYDPLSSLLNLWRHLYHEGWRRELPGWQDIGGPVLG
ncbi:MAG: hypothetical protein JWM21_485 [Acidobacteria bacterium]|nr:hypothetical protein [Acidobacteriota bacterium]